MRVESHRSASPEDWFTRRPGTLGDDADLVLVFAASSRLADPHTVSDLKRFYPNAALMGCSTAGEICDVEVWEGSVSVVVVAFEHTRVRATSASIEDAEDSAAVGQRLGRALLAEDLTHVFVLSDGQKVNGSDLVAGMVAELPPQVAVTGGLAGDGADFRETWVIADGLARSGAVAALGFYGDRLRIGYGSRGGWDPFGPERQITRSDGNVLYELDHRSALGLYKTYLDEHAAGLPATGLLFPLSLRGDEGQPPLVRTILNVDEATHSLIFAGDVPMGRYARLMKANFDRLVEGANQAGRLCQEGLGGASAQLSILVSCVGRKLVLKQRVEEEVEGVREALGDGAVLTGFYSYGEICPFGVSARCQLHNQTMTITSFAEV